jgi:squalene synthase HpnC
VQARAENFPVASRLFPKALRAPLLSIYGFARMADDIGDEADGDRLALLAWLSGELDAIFAARQPTHPLMRRLAVTIRRFDLPRDPFDRLIAANRQDQVVQRYATYADLADYCHLSADPVGELVLRLVGSCSLDHLALSDATCTALQLVEFLQDLGEDAAMGRIYLPREDLERFRYSEQDLLAGVVNERFVRLMSFEAGRAQSLFERGRPLSQLLPGRVGLAVRLFTAGGMVALADLRRSGFDTLTVSAHVSRMRLGLAGLGEVASMVSATTWARARGEAR